MQIWGRRESIQDSKGARVKGKVEREGLGGRREVSKDGSLWKQMLWPCGPRPSHHSALSRMSTAAPKKKRQKKKKECPLLSG
jgi:hypothetical protein